MAQTILGIDIGSYSVKVAELRRSLKSFQFTNWYERRIQYNEVLSPEESRAAALQAVLEDNALTWDQCYVGLPGDLVATRHLALPFGSRSKIDQTLPFEVEDHLPMPMEEIILDYHVIDATKELSQVLVFYARKPEIARFLSFVNNAGVEPRRLCVEGVELMNPIQMGLVPPEASFAILDIGHSKTTVTICRGRRFMFTRVVSLGGREVTAAIAAAVGVPDEEAERLKIELGQVVANGEFPPPETIAYKVLQAIHGVMERLLLSLRQTFFSYREQSGAVIEGIYLCGGTVRLLGIDEFLSFHLQQNVTHLDCHDFAFSLVDRGEVPRELAVMPLAMALRGVAPSGFPLIDFRRGEFIYRAATQQIESRFRRVGIALALIVVLSAGYFGLRWRSLASQVEKRHQEIVQLVQQTLPKREGGQIASASAATTALKKALREVEQRSSTLDALLGSSSLETLRRFSAAVPARGEVQLDVDKFHYQVEVVKVSASVPPGPEVDQIRRAIEVNLTTHKSDDGKRSAAPSDGGEPLAVEFPPAKTGAKGELKFDMIFKTRAALEQEKTRTRGAARRPRG